MYKLYRLWLPVCVCVCLRLLLLWPGPVLALPIGLYVPACLLQHFPLEMTGLSSPMSRGPCVISLLISAGSFFASHLSQTMSRVPLTSPTFLRAILSASFDQAPLGCLPPALCQGLGSPEEKIHGDFIWAPPPRSPCASPTTSWKRRGPQEGASPTSLLLSTHCWSSLRG